MKNFTPLIKLTSINFKLMIYRYRKTYMINNIEFTKSDKITLLDYFKNIDFIANFDTKKYDTTSAESKKRAAEIQKMQPQAKKIYKSLDLDELSNLTLYKETLKLI